MKSNMQLVALFLVATAAFAQRGGGFGGGFRGGGVGRGFAGAAPMDRGFARGSRGSVIIGGFPRGTSFPQSIGLPPLSPIPPLGATNFANPAFRFGRRFGAGFSPFYSPYFGAYLPLFDGGTYGYGEQYSPGTNIFIEGPATPAPASAYTQAPPPEPKPAAAVIHEYKWPGEPAAVSAEEGTFTIALKDGSKRSAIATWVQDNSLYYVEPGGKQQVLAAGRIDRDATQRLNRAKKLQPHLPSE
jgi:hypothetical protein